MDEEKSLDFSTGDSVSLTCYQHGCEGVCVEVVLGDPLELPYLGLNAGRLSWPEGSTYQAFWLTERKGKGYPYKCPNCNISFEHATIIKVPKGEVIIYGYDPEGA